MIIPETYVCAACRELFIKVDEAGAREDFKRRHPDLRIEDAFLVCDECFAEIDAE